MQSPFMDIHLCGVIVLTDSDLAQHPLGGVCDLTDPVAAFPDSPCASWFQYCIGQVLFSE